MCNAVKLPVNATIRYNKQTSVPLSELHFHHLSLQFHPLDPSASEIYNTGVDNITVS